MTVVAEGLGQMDQVASLQTLDCDLAQGYVFARPLPAAAAEQYLLKSASRALSFPSGLRPCGQHHFHQNAPFWDMFQW
jgi:predicted signal transduction protein with EAL and GGDEF domain